jgi:hypothetical protein
MLTAAMPVCTVVLAGLAISLETLADYVGEVAPTAGSYWVSAASATAVRRRSSGKQLPTAGAPPQSAVVIPASDGGGSAGSALAGNAAGSFVGRPASQEELASWREVLAGHANWSSAVSLLREYYSRHGFGITSRNSALRWSKGGFEEATEGGLAANYVPGMITCGFQGVYHYTKRAIHGWSKYGKERGG